MQFSQRPSFKRAIKLSLIAVGLQLMGTYACSPLVESSPQATEVPPVQADSAQVDTNQAGSSQAESDQADSAPTATDSDANFLWSVETPTNTVYLLGSVHILGEDDYPLAQPIQAAFEDAENIVFEIDLGAFDQQEAALLVADRAAPDSDEERLEVALTPETYALAEAAAADIGLPMAIFDQNEPWYFSINLVVLKLAQLGFSGEYGIDRYLFGQAVEAEKEVIGLETLEEQLDLFDNLSVETQQAFVEQTIDEIDTLEASFNELREAWHSGDVEAMEALVAIDPDLYPELHTKLLTERNLSWIEDITPMLGQSEDYLIVVGAAHMVGETGLVEQLESIGYSVEQR